MTFEFEYATWKCAFVQESERDVKVTCDVIEGFYVSERITESGIRALLARVDRDDTLWKELMDLAEIGMDDFFGSDDGSSGLRKLKALQARWEAK